MIAQMFSFNAERVRATRILTSRDAEECARLHQACFAGAWPAFEFETMLASRVIYGDGVFENERTLTGFALSRLVADEAEILSVAVDPAQRRRGLAGFMLLAHMRGLAHAGAARVFLEVEEGNQAAIALYSRLKFAQVGRRPNYYRGARHALVLRADLSEALLRPISEPS